jgi:hypothetical protein
MHGAKHGRGNARSDFALLPRPLLQLLLHGAFERMLFEAGFLAGNS